jgi:hypothetical protein
MAMSRTSDDDETIRRRSAWLIPFAVFFVTFLLSAMILLLYVAPSVPSLFEEQVAPTSRTDIIALRVRGKPFYIPANYLEYERTRQGGERREVALFAILPDFAGWSNWEAQSFAGDRPTSPIVEMRIHADDQNLSETDYLRRVYLGYVADKRGEPGPYGLTQFVFRGDSGYRDTDLYVGKTDQGIVVMRCERLGPDVTSPNCRRDTAIGRGVSLFYSFKRTRLSHWQDIAEGVVKLTASFAKAPK